MPRLFNASKIEPLNRIGEKELKVARELIYDERKFEGDTCVYDPLTEFTKLFEGVKSAARKKASKGETVEERLKNHIIDGEKNRSRG
jgi:5-methyltetrahydrofolate--homocysteine methyltransferase